MTTSKSINQLKDKSIRKWIKPHKVRGYFMKLNKSVKHTKNLGKIIEKAQLQAKEELKELTLHFINKEIANCNDRVKLRNFIETW